VSIYLFNVGENTEFIPENIFRNASHDKLQFNYESIYLNNNNDLCKAPYIRRNVLIPENAYVHILS